MASVVMGNRRRPDEYIGRYVRIGNNIYFVESYGLHEVNGEKSMRFVCVTWWMGVKQEHEYTYEQLQRFSKVEYPSHEDLEIWKTRGMIRSRQQQSGGSSASMEAVDMEQYLQQAYDRRFVYVNVHPKGGERRSAIDAEKLHAAITKKNPIYEMEQTECSICYEPFNNRKDLIRLPCKHIFHIKCIAEWFKEPKAGMYVCPLCKREYTQEQIYQNSDKPKAIDSEDGKTGYREITEYKIKF
jgi:hypothetical protein